MADFPTGKGEGNADGVGSWRWRLRVALAHLIEIEVEAEMAADMRMAMRALSGKGVHFSSAMPRVRRELRWRWHSGAPEA